MDEPTPAPSRLTRLATRAVRAIVYAVAAVLLLLTLVWVALHAWIVPRIDDYRPRLEAVAARVVGLPLRIGQLRAQTTGLVPSFELREVAFLDPQGRTALLLPRVVFSLSFQSVLSLGFDQLYIDGPQLDVRRGADGRIRVGGLDLAATDADPAAGAEAADWFFSQREFVIRGGTVRWIDEWRRLPPLALTGVDFVLRNGARRHDMRLDASPPAGWGDRFTVIGQFRRPLLSRHAGRWSDWSGQAYADFGRVDVSRLRQHAHLGIEVGQGHGAVRLWTDVVDGEMTGITADLALGEVTATLGPDLRPLSLRGIQGRLGGRRLASGFELFTQALRFETADGLVWPGGNVFVSHAQPEGRMPAIGEIRADQLDLQALSRIASHLPLGTVTHGLLRDHATQGRVESLSVRWQGALPLPERYEARGRVRDLVLAAVPPGPPAGPDDVPLGLPGFAGATVDFDFNQGGGRLSLDIADGWVEFPGLFEEPRLPLRELAAEGQWQIQGERIAVTQARLRLANEDTQGEFRGSWQTSDPTRSASRSRFPGVLDLQGRFVRARADRVHRYLPRTLPETARHYVRDAISGGTASDFDVRIRGDLWDLPYSNPRLGEFRFAGRVQGVDMAYVPRRLQAPGDLPWPALNGISGELVFDRQSMRVSGASARSAAVPGWQFSRIEARIPDLAHSTVAVSADGRGPLSAALGMVRGSPLGDLTGQVLGQATAIGDAALALRLSVPVETPDRTRVQGTVTLAGNDLRITPDTPLLARARATVGFTEAGFSVAGGQARLLGGDARIEGGSRPVVPGRADPSVVLRAQGQFSAEGLRAAPELGFLSRLARHAQGASPYSAVLSFRRGHPELAVNTSLQGMALSLPAPLAKPAETALPLRFENALQRESLPPDGAAAARLRDLLQLDIGRILSLQYLRDVTDDAPRVLRGAIAVGLPPGESAPLPAEGVVANVNLAVVDLDAWEQALSAAAGTSLAAPGGGSPAPTPGAARPVAAASGYLPTSLAVRARELTLQGRQLHDVVVGGSRDGQTWRATLDARELNGYLEYRQPTGAGAGRVYARLARLSLAPAVASDVENLLEQQPASIPALDVVVDDFELKGRKLGRVEVDAVNRLVQGESAVREWRLNRLQLQMPEAQLTASGNWAAVAAQAATGGLGAAAPAGAERRRTVMNFRLDVADAGLLLARFGMKDVLRRGRGRLEGQAAWAGSPLTLDYPSLSGQINLAIESGQFLKADPGLAKLLGVLSLQSLPRRLILDFRDVFSEGFAFDFIRGDATIAAGVASTNNLQMKGVNAAVLMEGKADINRETQDLRVIVVPEIDAGTASLVATAINPAIGIGTFLAQLILRRPLIQATTQEFHIDGTWSDPRVTRVDRKAAPAEGAKPPGSTP